jgi:hypothetical protein
MTAMPHEDDWREREDDLPRRRRTRLLTPFTLMLALVLLAAGGFVAGVLVEKGQTTTASALGGPNGVTAGATGARGFGGQSAGFAGGGGSRGTIGTVTNVDGSKLYVATTGGTTVEVQTTPTTKITKSESTKAKAIHPGDAVVVSGITASNGTVTASSLSDSGAGASTGLGSAFGGASSSTPTSSGGSNSLFGG